MSMYALEIVKSSSDPASELIFDGEVAVERCIVVCRWEGKIR
jgi:hypothetical protein